MPLQYFNTDGGRLAVEIDGSGPLVICSPGLGDHRDAYGPLSSQLIQHGYTVARMDNRGHGDSSTTFTRYGDEATADDFLFLISQLSPNRPAVLAGDSFAAGAATIAAGKNPSAVAGLILLGPFLRNPNAFAPFLTRALFGQTWGPALFKPYAATLWPGLGKEAASARAAETHAKITRPGYKAAFQKTVAGLDHSVVGPWIPKARGTPALVVMGDKDPDWSKPVQEAEWVGSCFEESTVLIAEGAGHAPMLESAEVVGQGVKEFLGKLREQGRLG